MKRCFGWCALSAIAVTAGLVGFTRMAAACGPVLQLTYVEASPDRFTMALASDADGVIADVTLDLSSSVGGAYVDSFYGPIPSNDSRAATLGSVSGFGSGSRQGTLRFQRFQPGQRFSLSIDLDDQVAAGNPNWLDGGEIAGARASATLLVPDGTRLPITGTFNANGTADLGARACG